MPANLDNLLSGLLDKELRKNDLFLQSTESRGKGLFTNKAIPEAEVILNASCLLFSTWPRLMEFLKAPGCEVHWDAATGLQYQSDGGLVQGSKCTQHAEATWNNVCHRQTEVMKISKIMVHEQPHTFFSVLVGASRFVNSFEGARSSPNAEWVFNPAAGPNPGAAAFAVQSW